MPRTTPVRQVMTTDVVTFRPETPSRRRPRVLSERHLGGAPWSTPMGRVLGLLEDDDLIVQDAKLHLPTVIPVLGAYIELPSSQRHFEEDLRKAVGATVADVMDANAPVCAEDDTLEQVATVMHDRNLSRLPVVREGKLVGIISRGDIVRALVQR